MKTEHVNLRRVSATITLDGESAPIKSDTEAGTLRVLGYRQGLKSLADGGTLGNSQAVRIRPAAMRALARSYVGRPFLIGHSFGDVTKRMGTIVGCGKVDPSSEEIGLEFEIELNEYGKSIVKADQVSEFSIGFAVGDGKVNCTLCRKELWTEKCFHWPGMKDEDGRICEVEFTDPEALELSAVNIGAVRGTMVLESTPSTEEDARAEAAIFALQVGRQPTDAVRNVYLAHRLGGEFAAHASLGTIEISPDIKPQEEDKMRQKLITKFGLSADATDDQIEAAMTAQEAQGALAAKALEQSIVDDKLSALKTRGLSDEQSQQLRAQYSLAGLQAFTNSVALVDSLLPTHQVGRAKLQSDKPSAALSEPAEVSDQQIDIEQMWEGNKQLQLMAKRMGLSRDQVIKHAPSRYNLATPEVAELFKKNIQV